MEECAKCAVRVQEAYANQEARLSQKDGLLADKSTIIADLQVHKSIQNAQRRPAVRDALIVVFLGRWVAWKHHWFCQEACQGRRSVQQAVHCFCWTLSAQRQCHWGGP